MAAIGNRDSNAGPDFYKRLKKYALTEGDLNKCGFPRIDAGCPGSAKIHTVYNPRVKNVTLKENEKLCCRCSTRFVVYPGGEYGTKDQCTFHWGRTWVQRGIRRYSCCNGARPCDVSELHVYDSNISDKAGYVQTLPISPPGDGNYGVYALDCEMVYTTGGMELGKVTVLGRDKQPVYETLVKPKYPVIDPNTRFSGIEKSDFKHVSTTLSDVQAKLLSLFNDRTILIGHSLQHDFLALKLIHNTVVDTSMVFPHTKGFPYRRALRDIVSDLLYRTIQNRDSVHDSREDALACLDLMELKLKRDA